MCHTYHIELRCSTTGCNNSVPHTGIRVKHFCQDRYRPMNFSGLERCLGWGYYENEIETMNVPKLAQHVAKLWH